MPVLFISSSFTNSTLSHWWLSPVSWSLPAGDLSSALTMSSPAPSPLLYTSTSPLLLATGSSLSICSALLAAPARPAPSSPSPTSSPTSTLSTSPPVHSSPSSSSSSSPPPPPSPKGRSSNKFAAGLVSGLVVAGLFNPWDRALYLSVLHERPFMHRENFISPYKGFFQALLLRTLSSGIYFPLFDLFQPVYVNLFDQYHIWRYPHMSASAASECTHPLSVHFLAGNTAGAVSGVVLNQLTAIKYASWDAEHGFFSTARHMWSEGGVRPFMKGIVPTVIRDTIFGGVFALTKEGCARAIRKVQSRAKKVTKDEKEAAANHQPAPAASSATASASLVKSVSAFTVHNTKTADFISSLLAGAMGTIVSSPFNFVRNIKYGWPASETPPTASHILSDLAVECKDRAREGGWRQGAAHMQDRLRIGWGTARVAVGMAFGYEIYEYVKLALDKTNSATHK